MIEQHYAGTKALNWAVHFNPRCQWVVLARFSTQIMPLPCRLAKCCSSLQSQLHSLCGRSAVIFLYSTIMAWCVAVVQDQAFDGCSLEAVDICIEIQCSVFTQNAVFVLCCLLCLYLVNLGVLTYWFTYIAVVSFFSTPIARGFSRFFSRFLDS